MIGSRGASFLFQRTQLSSSCSSFSCRSKSKYTRAMLSWRSTPGRGRTCRPRHPLLEVVSGSRAGGLTHRGPADLLDVRGIDSLSCLRSHRHLPAPSAAMCGCPPTGSDEVALRRRRRARLVLPGVRRARVRLRLRAGASLLARGVRAPALASIANSSAEILVDGGEVITYLKEVPGSVPDEPRRCPDRRAVVSLEYLGRPMLGLALGGWWLRQGAKGES